MKTSVPFSEKIIARTVPVFLLAITFLLLPAFGPALLATPLEGPYTIDATNPTGGTNFHSFNDFANSINTNGVSGHVIVSVVDGTGPYTEQVVFSSIPGTGPNATITLEGNGEVLTAVTNTNNRHILRLANCQYFTINNLNIQRDPSSTSGFYGIHIFSTGNHITISNCSVDMAGTTSTLCGAYVASGSTTSILETGDFHYLSFTDCHSNEGGYGVSVFGLVSNLASNIVITGNTFLNHNDNAVYLRETNGAVVANNTFDKTTTTASNWNAIQIAQNANVNAQIYNNVISVSQQQPGSATTRGIYLFNGTGHKVYNNVIHNINLTSGNFTGIEIRSANTAPEIYFNTISVDNTAATTGNLYGIKEELSNTYSLVGNNIISISQQTSGTKSALVLGTNTTPGSFSSNYNNIWIPGGNIGQKGNLTNIVYYPTLSNWQSVTGQDANTTLLEPLFVSATYSQPTNGLLDNSGTPISWVSVDITGAIRGIPPDVGAYEFSAAPPATPDSIMGQLSVCQNDVNVAYSVTPVTGATSYTWTVTGASLVLGQGTTSITVSFSNTAASISVVAVNNTGNSNPVTINVAVNPLPLVSFSLPQDTVCLYWAPFTLTGGSPINGTYTGAGISNNMFNPITAGLGEHVVTYSFEDNNGCISSANDYLYVDICTSIDDRFSSIPGIQLFPNPCTGEFSIITTGVQYPAVFILYNITGMPVREMMLTSSSHHFLVEEIPSGIYFSVITDSQGNRAAEKIEIR